MRRRLALAEADRDAQLLEVLVERLAAELDPVRREEGRTSASHSGRTSALTPSNIRRNALGRIQPAPSSPSAPLTNSQASPRP